MFKKIIPRIHRGNVLPLTLFLFLISGGSGMWWQTNQIKSEYLNNSGGFDVVQFMESDNFANLFYEEGNLINIYAGEGTISKSGSKKEIKIQESSTYEISAGDHILMNENSRASIEWFDGSISRLEGKIDLIIQKAEYDTHNPASTQISLFASEGKIWNKVNRLIDSGSEFKIESNESIAGVRGSTFNYFIATSQPPVVDCIEHAVYVQSKSQDKEDIIVEGMQATIQQNDLKIGKIPSEEISQSWYTSNKKLDKISAELNKEKYLNSIQALVGPLPNEPGYELKIELMNSYMNSIQDNEEKKLAEAKIGRMQFYESILLANKEGINPTQITANMNQSAQVWKMNSELRNPSDAPLINENKKRAENEQMKNELKLLEKVMGDILPDEINLYQAKEIIRQTHIELEIIPDKRLAMEERVLEDKFYEIIDLTQNEANNKIIEEQISKYENQINQIRPNLQNSKLKTIHNKLIESLTEESKKSIRTDQLLNLIEESNTSENRNSNNNDNNKDKGRSDEKNPNSTKNDNIDIPSDNIE